MNWHAIETVVVPVDLEKPSGGAVRLALEAAQRPQGVHVVYVLPELEPSLMLQIDVEHRRTNARRSLEKWLDERGLSGVSPAVRVGPAARAIADCAREVAADLVIIEARAHGAVSRALIGSVAERTLRLAPCPVLLVRPGPPQT